MCATHYHNIIFIIYDGIENSVFQSQVLQPIFDRLNECTLTTITLVSFEAKKINWHNIISLHERLTIILYKRLPFIIPGSLWLASYKLYQALSNKTIDQIIARGPLAGLITQRATKFLNIQNQVFIQARGLCAEEYRYAHQHTSWPQKQWHWLRYQQFKRLEKKVYGAHTAIEAVSQALKDYLINMFNAQATLITIAQRDIPKLLGKHVILAWRAQARQELTIPLDAFVYCYSGSYKPWQCATESIAHVADAYQHNKKNFLLVLSQDAELFLEELKKHALPPSNYRMLSAPANKLFYYLAAADAGLLFRHKDIVNWVARPTKALEYQAVGLKVIHNETINWLIK